MYVCGFVEPHIGVGPVCGTGPTCGKPMLNIPRLACSTGAKVIPVYILHLSWRFTFFVVPIFVVVGSACVVGFVLPSDNVVCVYRESWTILSKCDA